MSASRPKHGRIVPQKQGGQVKSGSPAPSAGQYKTTASRNTSILAKNVASASSGSSTKPKPTPRLPRIEQVKQATPVSLNRSKARATTPQSGRDSSAPITVADSGDEDEDDDFEEVPIPAEAGPSSPYPGTPTTAGTNFTQANTPGTNTAAGSTAESDDDDDEDSENGGEDGVIRLEFGGETQEEMERRIARALRKKPMTSKDRALRLEAHKLHVLSLLASARIRNRWCSHCLLQARLLSLLPHPLQAAFNIPPSRFPDRAQRSRLFFEALQGLVTWWSQSFFDVSDWTLGMRTRPWDEVEEVVKTLPRLTRADVSGGLELGKGKRKEEEDDYLEKLSVGAGAERLRTVNSLMKKALQQEGSRDVSAQLFVALARACGLGARLVVSLQAVPWRAEKVVAKKQKIGAGKGGRTVASRQGEGMSEGEEEEDDDFEEVPIPGFEEGGPGKVAEKIKARRENIRGAGKRRLQDPADLYRLRKPKPEVKKVGDKPKPRKREDLSQQPPVFWAEVFSRSDQRWIPVDPVQGIIRKKTHYEPVADNGPIRMLYVVAYEEDGYARDVTLRYTRNFGAKTVKLRVPTRKDEPDWWGGVMEFLQRPYRLNRDDLEDAELETSQFSEGMPMHMSGFKDHPIYVLERHLKREEVLHPKREIGRFRGEPVFRRANVLQCKTAENWMRVGRRVKDKQEPMKWVKQRAVTLQKRRQQELAKESGEEILQGLYSETQTEIYRPPPIKDGIIPQNSFGNIDLYAPTMLPKGAIHLPFKGIAKVAKGLGISYAEACTGFEFKKQRAIPVITGIVVAEDQESLVLEAYWESAAAAEEKERVKREDRALKRWVKLINGLRVRRRLQAEYGGGIDMHEAQHNPLSIDPEPANDEQNKSKRSAASVIANAGVQAAETWAERMRDNSLTPEVNAENGHEVKIERIEDITGPSPIDPTLVQDGPENIQMDEDVEQEEEDEKMAVQASAGESSDPEDVDMNPAPQTGVGGLDMPLTPPPAPIARDFAQKADASSTEANGTRQSGRKRKARNAPSAKTAGSAGREDVEERPRKRTSAPKRIVLRVAPQTDVSGTGMSRSLRSRGKVSQEQLEKEEEKRRRIQKALQGGSDDEDAD